MFGLNFHHFQPYSEREFSGKSTLKHRLILDLLAPYSINNLHISSLTFVYFDALHPSQKIQSF